MLWRAAIACLIATQLGAQEMPDRPPSGIADPWDLIAPQTEARIADRLTVLLEETRTEMLVAVIAGAEPFADDASLPDYADALFDAWAVGDTALGDGILLLVLPDERQLRLELGAGYAGDFDPEAGAIIDDVILPAIRDGDIGLGVEMGVDATITSIALPFKAPAAEVETDGGGGGLWWLLLLLGVPVGGIVYANRRSAARLAATPCPDCGATGLERRTTVLVEATETQPGQGETRTACPHCDWSEAVPYTIAQRRPAANKGDDDGPGGASGKW